jgi:hypothetical protein
LKRIVCCLVALLASCLLPSLLGCQGVVSPPPPTTGPTAAPISSPFVTPVTSALEEATPQATPFPSRIPDESPSPPVAVQPTWTPTPPPTPTPEVPTPLPGDQVVVRETTISLPAYVYEPHLRQALNEEHGVPYFWLDRAAYGEPAPETTVLRPFAAILLENRYLRLTILPELGGRLYECVFKPSGQNIFYRNHVVKPTRWGPLTREENWWLAAGGMEWAFPVNEHGYEWGVAWSYSVENSSKGATVTVRDTTDARPRVSVEIGLAPDTAYFTIRPTIENPTGATVSYQYWTNAMLTLGSSSVSPNTEFVYPGDEVVIHSAGPLSGLPGEKDIVSWPVWQGRDLSRYCNWHDWLGFFMPEPSQDFVGAYNHDTGLGVARVYSREAVPGVKLFAWGSESAYISEYTDNGSQYFEMWGGPNWTFWPEDDVSLEPGGSRSWVEYWYPFQAIEGLDYANRQLALSLDIEDGLLWLGLAATSPQSGTVLLTVGDEELSRRETTVSPESPQIDGVPLPPGLPPDSDVSFTFFGPEGNVVLRYETVLGGL